MTKEQMDDRRTPITALKAEDRGLLAEHREQELPPKQHQQPAIADGIRVLFG